MANQQIRIYLVDWRTCSGKVLIMYTFWKIYKITVYFIHLICLIIIKWLSMIPFLGVSISPNWQLNVLKRFLSTERNMKKLVRNLPQKYRTSTQTKYWLFFGGICIIPLLLIKLTLGFDGCLSLLNMKCSLVGWHHI